MGPGWAPWACVTQPYSMSEPFEQPGNPGIVGVISQFMCKLHMSERCVRLPIKMSGCQRDYGSTLNVSVLSVCVSSAELTRGAWGTPWQGVPVAPKDPAAVGEFTLVIPGAFSHIVPAADLGTCGIMGNMWFS